MCLRSNHQRCCALKNLIKAGYKNPVCHFIFDLQISNQLKLTAPVYWLPLRYAAQKRVQSGGSTAKVEETEATSHVLLSRLNIVLCGSCCSWFIMRKHCVLNSHHVLLIQIVLLQFVIDQMCFSHLSSEVQPLQSERAGAELQQLTWFRSEAAVWIYAEPTL